MAAAGLDHLKNDYRRRFCRPSRVPDISTKQGQSVLQILQDCFEEKSLSNDFSTNSTKSLLHSTPKLKDIRIQSSSKECQKSLTNSMPVSSRKNEACLPLIVEPSEAANKSVQAHEVHEKILATDVDSKNTPVLKNVSSRKLNGHRSEADGEFYLSVGSPSVILDAKTSLSQNAIPSIAQNRETYTLEKSVNTLSPSTEISVKPKKRLSFEDKDILKKVDTADKVSENEDKVSEGPQKRKPSGTSHERTEDTEYEIQPQAKKSFSTMFLETVKRKSESSSLVRHVVPAVPHSSSPNDVKLLEDEFIIDESDRSFASPSWITIPRKTGPSKQCTRSPVESTVLFQGKKLREKHHNITSETLTSDKHSHKAQPIQRSEPSGQKKLGRNCASTDEMENNNRSIKYALYSENAEKSSENKSTVKQKQRKLKATVVEEQLDLEQSKVKNINMSQKSQDKFQRNSNRNMEEFEEIRKDHVSKKQMPVGKKKSSTSVSHKKHKKKDKEELKNKHSSNGPKKNKLIPDEVPLTIRRSRRISRCPSNWWEVKPEKSPVCSSSSIRNELSVHHNSGQKSAKKKNQSSKNIREKTLPLKRQKRATQGSSSTQKKFLNAEDSGGITGHNEISRCFQNKSLENDKIDLAKKKNLDHSGVARSTQDPDCSDGIETAQNVHVKSQDTCKTPVESNVDSKEPETSVLEESGPSRLQNYLVSGKNNSDTDEKDVQESSDNSRIKSSKVTENKIHHKLVLPSHTPNVRRTKRMRLKPLEYWRGERIDYQGRPSGGFVIGGILSPDMISSKRKAKGNKKKVNKIANRKRICLDNDERKRKLMTDLNIRLGDPFQPTEVKDPDTREIILMNLVRPRDTYQFFVEYDELKVFKTLDTSYFSTGKLILGPCQEKGKQHVGPDTLVFYVDFGELLCTLHETPYVITTGDTFYVPSGNYYNIKNLLNEESILLFTQIKR
ncbi:centromere protein C isoform X1 [Dasypus novemcinctus]|uniref:centromere protein C isoform X1 n=2 Tax=Dasypus novemcinctus TaxID=9361 RepID=UPI00265E18EF|nr:centromere protein C isoform X2 [Dasypus novemcinctus]